MKWKTCWLEENDDIDVLKEQLRSEGFDAYQWSGRPGGEYLDYIHTQDEVAVRLIRHCGSESCR